MSGRHTNGQGLSRAPPWVVDREGTDRIGGDVAYFVVVNEQGPSWVPGTPMREQAQWGAHAQFVNQLVTDRFILLAGPLSGGPIHRAVLILQASSVAEARSKLAEDPWMRSGILVTRSVEPWQILASHDRFDPILAELARP
jgi:uncharacterized protein YciI